MARERFVKSASTRTPVTNSRGELERLLTRYGCSSFAVETDYEAGRATVSFVVLDSQEAGAARVPVRLEVRTRDVYDALYGRPTKSVQVSGRWQQVLDPTGYDQQKIAQAERVAWRQLILWVDAALSAAATGLQKISEAFLAHTLIQGPHGELRRVADHLDAVSGGTWKALLPPTTGGSHVE